MSDRHIEYDEGIYIVHDPADAVAPGENRAALERLRATRCTPGELRRYRQSEECRRAREQVRAWLRSGVLWLGSEMAEEQKP